jgi:hypothetical protein
MADAPTIIPGRRTITRVPTEGRIDHENYRLKVWKGGTVGEVVDQMNHDLGPVHDDQYTVTE